MGRWLPYCMGAIGFAAPWSCGAHGSTGGVRSRYQSIRRIPVLILSRRLVAPILAFAAALLVWEGWVRIGDVPTFLLPAPTEIAQYTFGNMGLFLPHIWATTWATLIGFTLSVAFGLIIAVAIVLSKTFEDAIFPLVVMTQVIPKVALAPLLVIYLGFGIEPKIFLAFLISFFPMVINTTLGMKSVSVELLELLATFKASKWQILTKVRIYRALPYMIEGAKISITLAVIGTVVAEFTAGSSGLGYLTAASAANLQTVQSYSAIVILVGVGILLFGAVHIGGRLLIPWAPPTTLESRDQRLT